MLYEITNIMNFKFQNVDEDDDEDDDGDDVGYDNDNKTKLIF